MSSVLRQSGDLTLSDTPLPAAMFSISEIWKINLVVGQDVQGRVNGVFRDAPLYEILDSILLSQGYGYRPVGRSLVILPLKDLGDLNPMFESATITLRYADPAEALESLRMLNSPQGKMQAVPSARSLMVLDFPDRVAMMRQFVQGLDRAAGEFPDPPKWRSTPIEFPPIRPRITGIRVIPPAEHESVRPLRRGYSDRFRASGNHFPDD